RALRSIGGGCGRGGDDRRRKRAGIEHHRGGCVRIADRSRVHDRRSRQHRGRRRVRGRRGRDGSLLLGRRRSDGGGRLGCRRLWLRRDRLRLLAHPRGIESPQRRGAEQRDEADAGRKPERVGAALALRDHGIGGAARQVDYLGRGFLARIGVRRSLADAFGKTHGKLHHSFSVALPACASAGLFGWRTGPWLVSVALSSPERSTISRGTPSTTIKSPRTAKFTGPSVPSWSLTRIAGSVAPGDQVRNVASPSS